MTLQLSQGLLSLILGVIILIQPKFLAWIIAIWLIVNGLISLGVIRF